LRWSKERCHCPLLSNFAGGYLLDEIKNDINSETPESFDSTIDSIVTKITRFAFERFAQADPMLTTPMKNGKHGRSDGDWSYVQGEPPKYLRSPEIGRSGLRGDARIASDCDKTWLRRIYPGPAVAARPGESIQGSQASATR